MECAISSYSIKQAFPCAHQKRFSVRSAHDSRIARKDDEKQLLLGDGANT